MTLPPKRRGGSRADCTCCGSGKEGAAVDDSVEPVVFGEKGDYWELYNDITDKFDQDMMDRLNVNLDNLLIFAGLFSAVNSAFIIVALGGLASNPSDETNRLLRLMLMGVGNNTLTSTDLNGSFTPQQGSVRQNCFFLASLMSSLLAAAGAVLAKQWLAYYERTGQTGPLDEQGLLRTEKYLGAERWRLHFTVELLPALILLSLMLFFVALSDFLWFVNQDVAIVAIASSATGAVCYGLMLILAAVFPDCPYQTAPSMLLRETFIFLKRSAIFITKCLLFACLTLYCKRGTSSHRSLTARFKSMITLTRIRIAVKTDWARRRRSFASMFSENWTDRLHSYLLHQRAEHRGFWHSTAPSPHPRRRRNADILYAESARSLLAISSGGETISAVAQNIPALYTTRSIERFTHSQALEPLIIELKSGLASMRQGGDTPASLATLIRSLAWLQHNGDPAFMFQILEPVVSMYAAPNHSHDIALALACTSPMHISSLLGMPSHGPKSADVAQQFLQNIFERRSKVSLTAVLSYLQHYMIMSWEDADARFGIFNIFSPDLVLQSLHSALANPLLRTSGRFLRVAAQVLCTILSNHMSSEFDRIDGMDMYNRRDTEKWLSLLFVRVQAHIRQFDSLNFDDQTTELLYCCAYLHSRLVQIDDSWDGVVSIELQNEAASTWIQCFQQTSRLAENIRDSPGLYHPDRLAAVEHLAQVQLWCGAILAYENLSGRPNLYAFKSYYNGIVLPDSRIVGRILSLYASQATEPNEKLPEDRHWLLSLLGLSTEMSAWETASQSCIMDTLDEIHRYMMSRGDESSVGGPLSTVELLFLGYSCLSLHFLLDDAAPPHDDDIKLFKNWLTLLHTTYINIVAFWPIPSFADTRKLRDGTEHTKHWLIPIPRIPLRYLEHSFKTNPKASLAFELEVTGKSYIEKLRNAKTESGGSILIEEDKAAAEGAQAAMLQADNVGNRESSRSD